AEDGIRDLYVTGVQTCALPIWNGDVESIHRLQQVHCAISRPTCGVVEAHSPTSSFDALPPFQDAKSAPCQPDGKSLFIVPLGSRSEERRVGKESRGRWRRGDET